MKTKKLNNIAITLILIAIAVSTRLMVPEHQQWNFTGTGSVLLFATYYFKNSKFNYLLPVIIMFISDLFLVFFYNIPYQSPINYLAFLSYILMSSHFISKIKIKNIALAGVSGATLFYLISNFLVWLQTGIAGGEYTLTFGGLIHCYIKGLYPFHINQLIADFSFSFIIFGVYDIAITIAKNLATSKKSSRFTY